MVGIDLEHGLLQEIMAVSSSGWIMASGKIKWFNNKMGYGFITQDSGQDVFLHYRSVMGRGYKFFNEGDEVAFDIIPSNRGLIAQNVRLISAVAPPYFF